MMDQREKVKLWCEISNKEAMEQETSYQRAQDWLAECFEAVWRPQGYLIAECRTVLIERPRPCRVELLLVRV